MEKEYKGLNGTLVLTDTGILIKRGARGFLLGGGMLRGDKNIPYASIVAVQYKKPGLTNGYIQFSLMGGSEAKAGVFQAVSDENSVMFTNGKKEFFLEAKNLIEQRIIQVRQGYAPKSDADDLEKYAALRDKGVITEEEFQSKKKQILSL